ncbi:hypothetical protein B0T16DRAFT_462712 [Cercophora newfieldiana]|uniref:Uncharacterized protein n=1 Tax=Cercophora newfieldiana TaxID=92897 RepID=A0AA39XTV2_9PEZI|nr:hypothetical protein B0T16DRAFT_462712 [Cercophora newfieldiana]
MDRHEDISSSLGPDAERTTAPGTALIMFSTLGYVKVFQAYYETNQLQGHSPDQIAWIGSL